jgi:hypothetical protein
VFAGHRSIVSRSIVVVATLLLAPPAAAIDLPPEAAQAYDRYQANARKSFIARIQKAGPLPSSADGVLFARAAREDGIVTVPGGLLHHWVAGAFIRGATLAQAIKASQAYELYPKAHPSVLSARVLNRQANRYRILVRLREGEAGITAVLDVQSTVDYAFPDARTAYAISASDDIRQIENAGEQGERRLPAGHDDGYLWRASAFTLFRQVDGGVYVEMETIGLSRRFPTGLGWLIEPIARRLGRRSVERSLTEFLGAVRK